MKNIKAAFLLSLIYSSSVAQVSIPGIYFESIDKLEDTASLSLYTSVINETKEKFQWLPIVGKISYNSSYPRGFNDGPVWKGKGFTNEIHFGIQGRKGKFSYTFLPSVFYSQNLNFYQADGSPNFSYPYSNRIDWVQRYGSSDFFQMHPGQSELKFETNNVQIAVSTQNYSLGPSTFNPIILSRQGGGFPHLRIGNKPKPIKNFGKIEGNLIIGMLAESEYFDDIPENDDRYINMLTLGYSPSFLPELTVGFNRSLYKQTQYFEAKDLLSTIIILDDGIVDGDTLPNDTFDQLASISIDWNIKEYGFRAYAEFAKNDFTSDGAGIRPTLVEPEHTRAFTIGFEKQITTERKQIRIGYEHSTLSINSAFLWRATPSFYTHGINRNGYAHNGQLLGAGIGPGGNSDHLHFQLSTSSIKSAIVLQRIEYQRDYFVKNITNSNAHNIEYTFNLFLQKDLERMVIFSETSIGKHYNRDFTLFKDDAFLNLSLGMQLKLN